MLSYLYLNDADDEDYYAMYMPYVQEVTEENEYEILKVMNECNNSMKSVKLVNNDGHVWIGYELRLPKDAYLSELVEHTVRGLYGAKMKFDMEMKGL
jgi:DNA-directed RNA polymerase